MIQRKKIGILTLHRAFNYGAVWQCYALKRACELLGHEAETLDYNPFGNYEAKWVIGKRLSVVYRNLKFMHQFHRFVREKLNPTEHIIDHGLIKANPPQEDIYIVGSDTVWSNAVAGEYLDSYLLDFAPSNVKRISYAASTGGNPMVLNDYQLKELNKFSAISIREKQSVPDVQKLTDIPVIDVCDPSLLLTAEEYEKIEKKPLCLPKHYMVYFDLAGDPFCAEAAKQLSKALHLPILNLGGKYKWWANYNYLAPTPEQWLYMMHHADYICTNSFHGAAFSIVFRRPFLCCAAQVGGRAKTNGRVQNLLEQTSLLGRYITSLSQICDNILAISYEAAEQYINHYRNRSLEWLKNAIEQ